MSQKSGYISHKKLTLDKNGTYSTVNITGQVFLCTKANFTFEMQFNDGGWFDFDQGLKFNVSPDLFTKMAFRAKNTDEHTELEYYTGGAEFSDARLSIIRDPNKVIVNSESKTLLKPFAAATIAAGVNVKFYGTGGAGAGQAGAAYLYRKAIIVTNNDPDSDLEVYKTEVDAAKRIGTVFARQAWLLESSDDVCIKNETGAAIDCRVCEVFYPA
jgi:hypothetical protein